MVIHRHKWTAYSTLKSAIQYQLAGQHSEKHVLNLGCRNSEKHVLDLASRNSEKHEWRSRAYLFVYAVYLFLLSVGMSLFLSSMLRVFWYRTCWLSDFHATKDRHLLVMLLILSFTQGGCQSSQLCAYITEQIRDMFTAMHSVSCKAHKLYIKGHCLYVYSVY